MSEVTRNFRVERGELERIHAVEYARIEVDERKAKDVDSTGHGIASSALDARVRDLRSYRANNCARLCVAGSLDKVYSYESTVYIESNNSDSNQNPFSLGVDRYGIPQFCPLSTCDATPDSKWKDCVIPNVKSPKDQDKYQKY